MSKTHKGSKIYFQIKLMVDCAQCKHQKITFAHYKSIPTKYVMVINPCAPLVSVSTYEKALDDFSYLLNRWK